MQLRVRLASTLGCGGVRFTSFLQEGAILDPPRQSQLSRATAQRAQGARANGRNDSTRQVLCQRTKTAEPEMDARFRGQRHNAVIVGGHVGP